VELNKEEKATGSKPSTKAVREFLRIQITGGCPVSSSTESHN